MRAYSAKEISHFNANIAMKDLIKISITSTKFHHINHIDMLKNYIDMLFCFMDHLVSFVPIFDSKNLKEEITHQDKLVHGPPIIKLKPRVLEFISHVKVMILMLTFLL